MIPKNISMKSGAIIANSTAAAPDREFRDFGLRIIIDTCQAKDVFVLSIERLQAVKKFAHWFLKKGLE